MLKTYTPALDLQRFFPSLETKTAVLLHPCRGRVADPFASKMGGQIAWPLNEEWPICPEHYTPMVTVLQLRGSDVPQLCFPEGKDIFQLLWCPTVSHETIDGYGPLSKTCWRDSKAVRNVLRRAPQNFVDTPEYCVPLECSLHVEQVQDYPQSYSLSRKFRRTLNEFIEQHGQEDIEAVGVPDDERLYKSLFDAAPVSKVGGHVAWIQDPEEFSCEKCNREMDHLLTISSNVIGNIGSRWRGLYTENGRRVMQQELWDQHGTDLCIGDMGRFYVMVCRRCEDRPIQTAFQCS